MNAYSFLVCIFAIVVGLCGVSTSILDDMATFEAFLSSSDQTTNFNKLWLLLRDTATYSVLQNSSASGYTILVPVDSAFTSIPRFVARRMENLKDNRKELSNFVASHILLAVCKADDALASCGMPFHSSSLLRVADLVETARTWSKLLYQPRAYIYNEKYALLSSTTPSAVMYQWLSVNGATVVSSLQFGAIVVHLVDALLVETDRGVTALGFLAPKAYTIQRCEQCNQAMRALLASTGVLNRVRVTPRAASGDSSSTTAFDFLTRLLHDDQSGGVTVFFPVEHGRNYVPSFDSEPERAYRMFASAIVRNSVLFTPAFRAALEFDCLRASADLQDVTKCALRVRRFGPSSTHLLVSSSSAINALTIVKPNLPLTNGVVHFVDGVFVENDSAFPSCVDTVLRIATSIGVSLAINESQYKQMFSAEFNTAFLASSAGLFVLTGVRLSYSQLSDNDRVEQTASGQPIRFTSVHELSDNSSVYTIVDLPTSSGLFSVHRFKQPDIVCTNGLVHLLAPLHSEFTNETRLPSLLQLVTSRGDLTVTLKLLQLLDFASMLEGTPLQTPTPHQQYTLFAPTDQAWLTFLLRRNVTLQQLETVFAKRNAFGRVAQRHVVLHAHKFAHVVAQQTPRIVEAQDGHYVLSAGEELSKCATLSCLPYFPKSFPLKTTAFPNINSLRVLMRV